MQNNELRGKKLQEFVTNFNLPIISIEEIAAFKQTELYNYGILSISSTINLPTSYVMFKALSFKALGDDKEHFVLMKNIHKAKFHLVRIHSECLTDDVFKYLKYD